MKKVLFTITVVILSVGLLFPAAVLADRQQVDNDVNDPGNQNIVNLSASPGATVNTSAQIVIEWSGNNHLKHGDPLEFKVIPAQTTLPAGYSVSDVTGTVPNPWAEKSVYAVGWSTISFTAPAIAGSYTYDVKWEETHRYGNNLTGANAFEINLTVTEPEAATLTVVKFFDANANGVKDTGEQELDGWAITVDGSGQFTPFSDVFAPGTYTVTEYMPNETNWMASGVTVKGTTYYDITSNTEVEVTLANEDDVTILFGNYCLKPSGGKTLGFWSNNNGQALFYVDDLAAMVALNLRNANGSTFDPVSYAAFKTWLLGAKATNMAYMLSAQLAAMKLNVLNELVEDNAFYIPYGGTINQLIIEADTELGLHGSAPAGNAHRSYQETLKNYLDALNNGALVIPPTPCPYTFPE